MATSSLGESSLLSSATLSEPPLLLVDLALAVIVSCWLVTQARLIWTNLHALGMYCYNRKSLLLRFQGERMESSCEDSTQDFRACAGLSYLASTPDL